MNAVRFTQTVTNDDINIPNSKLLEFYNKKVEILIIPLEDDDNKLLSSSSSDSFLGMLSSYANPDKQTEEKKAFIKEMVKKYENS